MHFLSYILFDWQACLNPYFIFHFITHKERIHLSRNVFMGQTQRSLPLDSALLTTRQGSLASDWKRLVPVYAALGAG